MTRRDPHAFGRLLQGVVLGAGLWLVVTSLLAAVLSALGWWHPVLVLPALVLVALGCARVVRGIPAPPLSGAVAGALLVLALAGGAWTAATHSEQVLPRRDAASYLQGAISLADTHRRVVPVDPASVGGPEVLRLDGVTLASPAFYQVGTAQDPAVQPQFVIGPSAVWSLGRWVGGLPVMLALPALFSALSALGVGLLTARTVGARWGPLGTLGTLLLFPVLHTGRATYSEPLALLTLAAGLLALVVAASRETRARDAARAALVAGVLVGGTAFLRVDGLRETILLVPVAGLYAAQGRRWPSALLIGAAASTALAAVAGLVLSSRYLGSIAGSLVPLLALGMLLVALTLAGSVAARRGARLPSSVTARLPGLLAGGVVAVGALLASRPLWLTVRQSPSDPGARMVAGLQLRAGLAVDGGRTYAEDTVTWLAWWVGPVALVLALVALAFAVRAAASRWRDGADLPGWTGPLLVAAGSAALTLWRPGITPDHPWAERRLLIPLVLVVVLVLAAAAAVAGAERGVAGRVPRWGAHAVAAIVVLALVLPTALATWPHATERVEAGSVAAVEDVCALLGERDVVLAVDSRAANEWPQVVRGMCARPTLSTTSALREDPARFRTAVSEAAAGVTARGGRLVLLAADDPDATGGSARPDALRVLGARDVRVATDRTVLEDPRRLEQRPSGLVPLRVVVRLAAPGTP